MPPKQTYEVEVKVLLGSEQTAEDFVSKLHRADPKLKPIAQTSQLNHYFDQAGDPEKLLEAVKRSLSQDDFLSLKHIVETSTRFALRTREEDGVVRLVVKAAKGDEDEQHALERLEGDYVTSMKTIDDLDALIRSAGYDFLSKWSRDRTEYAYKDYVVCMDKNAGYGYLAEIEKVVGTEEEAAAAKTAILAELDQLGFEELPQERLSRMFAHYNQHWPEYYRTDKTFTVA